MHYTKPEFEFLPKEYGKLAGWAIWDYTRKRFEESSSDCIFRNIHLLNTKNVFIG
jgi:hypothetical protein